MLGGVKDDGGKKRPLFRAAGAALEIARAGATRTLCFCRSPADDGNRRRTRAWIAKPAGRVYAHQKIERLISKCAAGTRGCG